MWFGTKSGLNKYDGYEFVIYKNKPFDSTSISNNQIQSTLEKIGQKSSQLIIDNLVDEIDKWRNGNSPNDDVTLVVLKVKNSN